MRKIPTVYLRDYSNPRFVTDELNPAADWVTRGEGIATRKYDGTCIRLDEAGRWWARREVKSGKPAPDDFQLIETDDVTGKAVGWIPAGDSSFAKFLAEALLNEKFALVNGAPLTSHVPGTYELCGPRINGNPERLDVHLLIPHGDTVLDDAPREFKDLRDYLLGADPMIEGIVWWHDDGRMAKLKVKDMPRD